MEEVAIDKTIKSLIKLSSSKNYWNMRELCSAHWSLLCSENNIINVLIALMLFFGGKPVRINEHLKFYNRFSTVYILFIGYLHLSSAYLLLWFLFFFWFNQNSKEIAMCFKPVGNNSKKIFMLLEPIWYIGHYYMLI